MNSEPGNNMPCPELPKDRTKEIDSEYKNASLELMERMRRFNQGLEGRDEVARYIAEQKEVRSKIVRNLEAAPARMEEEVQVKNELRDYSICWWKQFISELDRRLKELGIDHTKTNTLTSVPLPLPEETETDIKPIVWTGKVNELWHLWELLENRGLVRGFRNNWGKHFVDVEANHYKGDGKQNLQNSSPSPTLLGVMRDLERGEGKAK
jgi:hypothetical protein